MIKSVVSIANTMLKTSYVTEGSRKGKFSFFIFIDKDGDVNCVNNWSLLTSSTNTSQY